MSAPCKICGEYSANLGNFCGCWTVYSKKYAVELEKENERLKEALNNANKSIDFWADAAGAHYSEKIVLKEAVEEAKVFAKDVGKWEDTIYQDTDDIDIKELWLPVGIIRNANKWFSKYGANEDKK